MHTVKEQSSQEQLTAILDHFTNETDPFSPGQVKDLLITIMMDAMANPKGCLLTEKEHGFTIYKLHQFTLMLEKMEKPREFRKAVATQLRPYGMTIEDLETSLLFAIDKGKGNKKDMQMTTVLQMFFNVLR